MKDPYLNSETGILKNRLGIKDQKSLDNAETAFASIAMNNLRETGFEIATIRDCLLIHQKLFDKVYDWAGQPRTIDIYKGESILDGKSIDYVFASYINQALEDLEKEFKVVKWEKLNPGEKIDKICYFVSEFWHIHPFREGNTRTAAMMLYFLIKKAGLHVNINFLSRNGKYFRNALVLSCLYTASKPEYLKDIVRDSVTFKNVSDNKYKTIEGIEFDKYSYVNHTIDKLKTIEKPKDWMKKPHN